MNNKSLILNIMDFTNEIATIVNNHSSDIPAMIMIDKLNEAIRALEPLNQQQIEVAKADYEKEKGDGDNA